MALAGTVARLRGLLGRQPPIATPGDLGDYLSGQASLIAQKATIEYCRLKAAGHWTSLLSEEPFAAALARVQWDAFAAVLSDAAVVAEGKLRPHAGHRAPELADALTALARGALAAYPLPAHRPEGWDDILAALRDRLAHAQLAAPRPVREVARHGGDVAYDGMPIHPSLRAHDRALLRSNVAFNLCRTAEDLERRADLPALTAALLDGLAPA